MSRLISAVLLVTVCMSNGSFGTHKIWNHTIVGKNYNKHLRPTTNWNEPTAVNFSFSVIALIEFDEVKETISLTGKLSLAWIDEYFQWDPAHFDNVSRIHVPQTEIWKPYVLLENSVTAQTEMGTPSLQLLVHHTGKVEWSPVQVFQSTCSANVRKFPFDTQVCYMTFEEQGYSINELKLSALQDHIEFHEYSGTSGWTIGETKTVVREDMDVTHIICTIKMSRNPLYFLLNIFLPISLLSFLNICVFILPVESGEKANFVVTVFLSLAVFLMIVSGKLPENSESIAFLNIYVFISTLLSTIIAIVTILLIRLYHRDPAIPVPWYLVRMAKLSSSSDKSMKPDDDVDTEQPTENGQSKTKVEPFKKEKEPDTDSDDVDVDHKEVPISWRRVVKALDNLCFLLFLCINLTMTISILALAAQEEHDNLTRADGHGH